MPVVAKYANQRHLLSVRDGFIGAMPLMIVGSFLLILAFPPFPEGVEFFLARMWMDFAAANFDALMMPFSMTMGIMTIFVAVGIGSSLARRYKIDPVSGSMLSVMSFLLVAAQVYEGGLPVAFLGGRGIFTAMFVSIFAVEVLRIFTEKGWVVKLPEGVPPAILRSFEALVPTIVCIGILFPLSIIVKNATGMTVPAAVMALFEPLVVASDSIPALLLAVVLCHLLWFAGIHGGAIVGAVMSAFWLTNLEVNQAALAAGDALPHVFLGPLWHFYMAIGGAGATLVVLVLFLRCKSAHLRTIGKIGLLPGLFNINEPVTFGAPIVMNPTLFVPFVLAPVANALIAFLVLRVGLVPRIVALAPWTSPAPIGAMWATGWFVTPALLVVILFFVSGVIYYPFVKMYDKQLFRDEELAKEKKQVEHVDSAPSVTA